GAVCRCERLAARPTSARFNTACCSSRSPIVCWAAPPTPRTWLVDLDRLMTRLNPVVAWLLRSPLHPLLSGALMLLQVTGRRTGRRYWIPVGYQRDGSTITVLVSRARRK